MASLASKDSYLQKLASKVCAQQNQTTRERPYVPFRGGGEGRPLKNNNKTNQKQTKGNSINGKHKKQTLKPNQKPAISPAQRGPNSAGQSVPGKPNGPVVKKIQQSKGGKAGAKFSTVDILRQRLHQKIEESRGQGTPKDSSSEEVMLKRQKRKQERERKKRKRKEFRRKKLAEEAGKELVEEIKKEEAPAPKPAAAKRDETAIVFNTVDMGEVGYLDKVQQKKEKKNRVKGTLTPLTGKNYKQLLGRVELRKAKLEELREKDEDKAREVEEKMKWTNVLYKAEGLKIKDDEDLLRASLKRKEKMRSQKKKRWTERSQNVVEKMQHRQDKRRKNIQKQNKGKVERKKDRARKRGRVLPEDLKKAAL